jgi:hypothetical protein
MGRTEVDLDLTKQVEQITRFGRDSEYRDHSGGRRSAYFGNFAIYPLLLFSCKKQRQQRQGRGPPVGERQSRNATGAPGGGTNRATRAAEPSRGQIRGRLIHIAEEVWLAAQISKCVITFASRALSPAHGAGRHISKSRVDSGRLRQSLTSHCSFRKASLCLWR